MKNYGGMEAKDTMRDDINDAYAKQSKMDQAKKKKKKSKKMAPTGSMAGGASVGAASA